MNTKVKDKIEGTAEAWDERVLGANKRHAKHMDFGDEQEIDAALELQPISIRLQKSLIEDFKLIAEMNSLGYQPLMRQVLTRFVDCEKKRILREMASEKKKERITTLEEQESRKKGRKAA